MIRPATLVFAAALACAAPAHAAPKSLLGVFGNWAAFRDPAGPRCYAIAHPARVRAQGAVGLAWADVGDWPARHLTGRVHLRLGRALAATPAPVLTVGDQHIALIVNGADAWPADPRGDAAVVAAMRSAPTLTVTAHDTAGKEFALAWPLEGAATAIDAALVGCAR